VLLLSLWLLLNLLLANTLLIWSDIHSKGGMIDDIFCDFQFLFAGLNLLLFLLQQSVL